MKRNLIRLLVLSVVVGSGWFTVDQLRHRSELSLSDDSQQTATAEDQLSEETQQPMVLASGPEIPVARGQEPAQEETPEVQPNRFQPIPDAQELRQDGRSYSRPNARLVGHDGDIEEPTPARLAPDAESDASNLRPIDDPRAVPSRYEAETDDAAEPAPDARFVEEEPVARDQSSAVDSGERSVVGVRDDFAAPRRAASRYEDDSATESASADSRPLGAPVERRADPFKTPPPQQPAALLGSEQDEDGRFAREDLGGSVTPTEGNGRPGARQLEGAQTPSLTLEKIAPEEIQIGKECVFEVRVRNTGQVAAAAVEIHDEIPEGTRLVSMEPRGIQEGSRLVWRIGSLAPGDETTVQTHLMPTIEGEVGSVATVRFQTQASVRTTATRPELELRVSGPRQVMIGEDVTLAVEISNPGSGATTGVMLLENVPEGFSHPAGQSLEFEVGTLEPGDTRQMELVLTAEQAGTITNTLVARAEGSLEVQEVAEIEVISPELKVSIQGPKRRFLDRKATYTLSIDNPGTASAKEVELVSHLPKGMEFVEANNNGEYDAATHSVFWSLAELPAKQQGEVELIAVAVASGEQTLRVEGKSDDGLTDQAEQQISVEGVAAIMFEVVDVNDPILVEEETTYEIRVVNQGSKAATNVVISVLIPEGMEPVSAAGATGHSIDMNRVQFESLRHLAPKADTTYRVKVKGRKAGDQRVRVQVVTDELQDPVTKEESTRVYADE